MLFQLVLVLYWRVLEMTGEILGGVRKEGSKVIPFHNEGSQVLEQVGRRGCAVSFLGGF